MCKGLTKPASFENYFSTGHMRSDQNELREVGGSIKHMLCERKPEYNNSTKSFELAWTCRPYE